MELKEVVFLVDPRATVVFSRIPKMELKVRAPSSAHQNSSCVNSKNGIERSLVLSGIIIATAILNSKNGIESEELCGSLQKTVSIHRIPKMELKGPFQVGRFSHG